MQYILVKGDVIEVNPYASSYSIELNVFGLNVRYKLWHLSEGNIWLYLHSILRLLSEGGYYEGYGY